MKTTSIELTEQWRELLAQEPNLRIRDAALRLGVSEAELLATRCGDGVARLEGEWRELIKGFPRLGRVMCLTRNEHAVHERYGVFATAGFFGGKHGSETLGQVVGPDIDLRFFMEHWHFGFAVEDKTAEGTRRSFQFFDCDGTAVHKVYLQAESDVAAFNELVELHLSSDQEPSLCTTPVPAAPPELPDAAIDKEAFQRDWLDLKDTHQFFILQMNHRVGREQALRLAPEGYAWRVSLESTRQVLDTAAKSGMPIMVFVGSPGCVQIHTGPVQNIKMFGSEWLNVLDPEFNLHLRQTAVARAWVVRKPTRGDGVVTSLELFDANGENLALFFGKRKPGVPEDGNWRAVAENLPKETVS